MLIITGSLAYDYIMGFPGSFADHILPEHIRNINLSFIVNKYAKRRGGTAGNVSYTLGLLGIKHKLFSYAGNDFAEYQEAFEKLGIDTSYVAIDENDHTATGFALADEKQNQIWGFYYGAAAKNGNLQLKDIADKDDYILVGPQGAEGSLSFIRQCIALKLPYMFDPGFILTQVSNKELEHGIEYAHTIIGNDYEITLMKDRIKNWDDLTEGKTIITTLGENGTIIQTKNETHRIQPAKVNDLKATTGAGDAWRGGYLAGIEKGFEITVAGEMGAVAGAYAVEFVGTQEHQYTKQEFTKRYKETYNKNLEL